MKKLQLFVCLSLLSPILLFSQTKKDYQNAMEKFLGDWIVVKESFEFTKGNEFPAPEMKMTNTREGDKYISTIWSKSPSDEWQIFSTDTTSYDKAKKCMVSIGNYSNSGAVEGLGILKSDGSVHFEESNSLGQKTSLMIVAFKEEGKMHVQNKVFTDEEGKPVSEAVMSFNFHWVKK